jgi:transcriptional regulator with XRE-family HTH domain
MMNHGVGLAVPGFTDTKVKFSPGKRMRLPTVVVRGDVLASWLTISDYSRSRLAADLAVSKGRVSQLLTSKEEPSAHLIAKLITLTHLPFDRLFQIVRDLPSSSSTIHPVSSPRRLTKKDKKDNNNNEEVVAFK